MFVAFLAVWESPLVPRYLPYCDDKNPKQENCPTYEVTRLTVWEIGNFLDVHNGAIVALFTAVLSIFTIGLYRETAGLREAADRQKIDTQKALESAEKAATAAAEQTKLARDEFNAAHRPRLKLRLAAITNLTAGQPMEVLFRIANVGDALGRTVVFQREIGTCEPGEFARGLPDYVHSPSTVTGEILPGDYFEVAYLGALAIEQSEIEAVSLGSLDLVLYGEIACTDINGNDHRSGFFRRYDPKKGRFCIADDPDLEYDD